MRWHDTCSSVVVDDYIFPNTNLLFVTQERLQVCLSKGYGYNGLQFHLYASGVCGRPGHGVDPEPVPSSRRPVAEALLSELGGPFLIPW